MVTSDATLYLIVQSQPYQELIFLKKIQKQFSNFKHLMVTCENNIVWGKNARESDSFAFVGINIYWALIVKTENKFCWCSISSDSLLINDSLSILLSFTVFPRPMCLLKIKRKLTKIIGLQSNTGRGALSLVFKTMPTWALSAGKSLNEIHGEVRD